MEVANNQAIKEQENMEVGNYQAIRQEENMETHSGDQSRTIQPTKSSSTRNNKYQIIVYSTIYFVFH